MEQQTAEIGLATTVWRSVVRVDADRCDGCGLCAARCPEGAIRLVEGRAELVCDEFCDGVGFCVGVCPNGAIRMEQREAAPFDVDGSVERRVGPGTSPEKEFRRRLSICCNASKCARLCPRLTKQPGRAGVWCVDLQSGGKTYLYEALADPAFKCPEERF